MYKVLAIVGFLLAVAIPSFGDEIEVPFSIYKQDFINDALQQNFDLTDGRDAHGFIQSRGNHFTVYTYKRATNEQLELIKTLTWKHLRN